MKPVSDQQNTAEFEAKPSKNHPTAIRHRKRLLSDRSLLVGLSCLASLGMLSKGIVWAQAETPAAELTVPAEPEPEPVFELTPPANPEPPPVEAAAPPEPEPETYAAPPAEIAPEPEYIAPAPEPEYIPEPPAAAAPAAPDYYLPEPELIPLPAPTAQEPEPPFEAPINPANAYIDSTDYSLGATNGYDSPTAVEFAERSTGCQTVLESGQSVGSWCGGGDSAPVASGGGSDSNSRQNPIAGGGYIASPPVSGANNVGGNIGGNRNTAAKNAPYLGGNTVGRVNGTVNGNAAESIAGAVGQAVQQIGGQLWGQQAPPPPGYGQPALSADFPGSPAAYSGNSNDYASAAYYGGGGGSAFAPSMGFGPIPVAPISVTSGSSTASAYYNLTQRPAGLAGNGNTSLLFPLSIAAAITSPFGWRVHPVMGYGRFHTGTDLGAPLGTPVLAAYAGQVAIADWLGGYGLTVVLNHNQQSQETLYAHLSELFVKPGEFVKQGETIGRVGSTGMSTGPHLHFEIRQMTDRGWVAIDPGSQLEFALARMLGTLQTAKVPEMPKILPAQASNSLKDLESDLPQLPPLPVGMDIEVVNLQPPFPELLKTDTAKSKNSEVAKPKIQKQASR